MAQQPLVGQGLQIIEALRSHTDPPHSLGRTPLGEWQARRRDLYLITHDTYKTQTSMPPGDIRISSPSKGAATDPRPRLRSLWGRSVLDRH